MMTVLLEKCVILAVKNLEKCVFLSMKKPEKCVKSD